MAKRNYLVEGLSGAGKSSVYEELVRRGYTAITTDRAWAYHADPDTGLTGGPIHHDTVRVQLLALRAYGTPSWRACTQTAQSHSGRGVGIAPAVPRNSTLMLIV